MDYKRYPSNIKRNIKNRNLKPNYSPYGIAKKYLEWHRTNRPADAPIAIFLDPKDPANYRKTSAAMQAAKYIVQHHKNTFIYKD